MRNSGLCSISFSWGFWGGFLPTLVFCFLFPTLLEPGAFFGGGTLALFVSLCSWDVFLCGGFTFPTVFTLPVLEGAGLLTLSFFMWLDVVLPAGAFAEAGGTFVFFDVLLDVVFVEVGGFVDFVAEPTLGALFVEDTAGVFCFFPELVVFGFALLTFSFLVDRKTVGVGSFLAGGGFLTTSSSSSSLSTFFGGSSSESFSF